MRRLNWGCGPDMRAGWVNSDMLRYPAVHDDGVLVTQDHLGAVADGLPWPDETFDYIVSHHVLQMIAWPDLVPALVELRRVLKPGGWLRLSVPDLQQAFAAFERRDRHWFPIDDRHETSVDGKLCMYIVQAGASRSVFTNGWLLELLQRASFERMRLSGYRVTRTGIEDLVTLDSRPGESLIVDARR